MDPLYTGVYYLLCFFFIKLTIAVNDDFTRSRVGYRARREASPDAERPRYDRLAEGFATTVLRDFWKSDEPALHEVVGPNGELVADAAVSWTPTGNPPRKAPVSGPVGVPTILGLGTAMAALQVAARRQFPEHKAQRILHSPISWSVR